MCATMFLLAAMRDSIIVNYKASECSPCIHYLVSEEAGSWKRVEGGTDRPPIWPTSETGGSLVRDGYLFKIYLHIVSTFSVIIYIWLANFISFDF